MVIGRVLLVLRELRAHVVEWDYRASSVPLGMMEQPGSKVERSVLILSIFYLKIEKKKIFFLARA